MVSDENKWGIWGNEECAQCGACCYDNFMLFYQEPCHHQKIQNGKSICMSHDNQILDSCKDFFCGQLNEPEHKKDRERFRNIAVKLGTAPPNYDM